MNLNLAKVPFGKWMNERAKRSSIASRQCWKLKSCFRAHFWSLNSEYEVINSYETYCDTATVSTAANKFPIFQIRDIYLLFHWPFVIINNEKTQPKAVNCKVRRDQKKISPKLRLRSSRGSVPVCGAEPELALKGCPHSSCLTSRTFYIFQQKLQVRNCCTDSVLHCVMKVDWKGQGSLCFHY